MKQRLLSENEKYIVLMSDYANGDGTDETTSIQTALDHSIGKILIWTKQSGSSYVTNPLIIHQNTHIIFQAGTLVKANSGYRNGDNLFRLTGDSITIDGNYATIQMLKSEYSTGEQRHGIYIMGVENIAIRNLVIKNTGGDGIIIGSNEWSTLKPSKNIRVSGCILDNNKRQGISVVGADDVLIDNCTITNTNGTSPQAGIDIEPNNTKYDNNNITIQNSYLSGNVGGGILTYNNSYNVTIQNNTLVNNPVIIKRQYADSPQPTVKIKSNTFSGDTGITFDGVSNCSIEGNTLQRIYLYSIVGNCSHNSVINNRILNSFGNAAVSVESNPYVVIKGNHIENSEHEGISLTGSQYSNIEGNTLISCSNESKGSIKLQNCAFSKIVNNTIRRSSKNTKVGIMLSGGGNTDTLIENNDLFDSAVSKDISSDSENIVIGINTFLDGKKSAYTVPNFLPPSGGGWLGRNVILKKNNQHGKMYTCVESDTGTYQFREIQIKYKQSSAPMTGTWGVGDIVYNSTPIPGGMLGWICVNSGSPGIWKAFGKIDT